MSVVSSRPLGEDGPPETVLVSTPAAHYGLLASLLPSRADARLLVRPAAGGAPLCDTPLAQGRNVNGFLLFALEGAVAGERYDGFVATGGNLFSLFEGADLFRLAVDDPTYRALPSRGGDPRPDGAR